MRLSVALVALASCASRAVPCDDGTFCPEHTSCGGAGVCLVDEDACARFEEGAVCERMVERGRCTAGACVPQLELLGAAVVQPRRAPLPGIRVIALGHPEVEPAVTNENEFFSLKNLPPASEIVLELTFADALSTVIRPVALTDADRSIDREYGGIPLIASASIALIAASTGIPILPGTGLVGGTAFGVDGAFAGLTATAAACTGPFYLGAELVVVNDATGTLASDGSFVFVNCPPGSTTLSAAFPGRNCQTADGLSMTDLPIDIAADRLLWLGRITCN